MRLAHALFAVCLALACAKVAPPPYDRTVDYDAGSTPRCGVVGSARVGDHCDCTSDCDDTTICVTEALAGFPRGLCTRPCPLGSECGPGSRCVAGVCLRSCQSDSDCASGNHCTDAICLSLCDSDDDCESNNCNRYSGFCLDAGAQPSGKGIDAACTSNEDCRSGNCRFGHCFDPCFEGSTSCPDDGICVGFAELDGGIGGNCALPCLPGDVCTDPDRRCQALLSGMAPSCLPDGFADDCFGAVSSATAGLACGCSADCDPGQTCAPEKFNLNLPYGMCLQSCSTSTECPDGGVCVGLLGVNDCYAGCSVDADCGHGRLCAYGACAPWCVEDSDCRNGTCDTYSGLCHPTATVGAGPGQLCSGPAACKSQRCENVDYALGRCISLCSTERGSCPDQTICAPIPAVQGPGFQTAGFCSLVCTTKADCPQAEADCVPTPGSTLMHCE